ncbi:MAG: hypothetical protein IK088_01025 [Lachnospiraceae bacterium]|nr:hypothetical protein [Lachnospiraceae bacterium]
MNEKERYTFRETDFRDPGPAFRGAPFWSWNALLTEEGIERGIDEMKTMGFGGFHIHSRIGLKTPYLGEEFMRLVLHAERCGEDRGMLTYLYDEDKWPSGAAGGLVTKDRHFAAKYLLFSPVRYSEGFLDRKIKAKSRLSDNGDISLLYRYEIAEEGGKIASYRRLKENEPGNNVWYAYRVVTEPLEWFNNAPYLDVLDPEAVKRFTLVTHEAYGKVLGSRFGTSVPSIFTDEPSFHVQEEIGSPETPSEGSVAWTDGFESYFRERYGYSIEDRLPELFLERADGVLSKARLDYHDALASRFRKAYAHTIRQWCDRNGLLMTGHLLFEEKLESQSRVCGETMRVLSEFSLPGIDMLADRHEYTTVKQAASVAHQYGTPGVMCELYGVTNWDFDFRGHRHQGDWLAALGVTHRVHHLVWMTMAGESKRDYPSPIDGHTTWYRKYPLIEDHFARLNTALMSGKPVVRVAVIHPIESYWILMGPEKETAEAREKMETRFQRLTEWLLFGLIDFDYISEALLPDLYRPSEDGKLHVGEMEYDAVIVPELVTVRRTTLDVLKGFSDGGGTVFLCGSAPSYVDGLPSEDGRALERNAKYVPDEKEAILEALEPFRTVRLYDDHYTYHGRLFYQLRTEGETKWLFLAPGKHDDRLELTHWTSMTGRETYTVEVGGSFDAILYDTETGLHRAIPVKRSGGKTAFELGFHSDDSYLIRLLPPSGKETEPERAVHETHVCSSYLPESVPFTLSEPNVMLLDQASYHIDGGPWHETEEILKADEKIRSELGYRLRNAAAVQPWVEEDLSTPHTVTLRYRILSEKEMNGVSLGYEWQEGTLFTLNGTPLRGEPTGFYVDRAIRTIPLGTIPAGESVLEVRVPFGVRTDLESGYLLGNFGVRVRGRELILTDLPDKVSFGELKDSDLPFYGGSITYESEITTDDRTDTVEISVKEYSGALLTIALDGEEKDVYRDPVTAVFRSVRPGSHSIRITLYGTRINTFGQLHNCNRKERYWGNKTWRTSGENWHYGYCFRPAGILTQPIVRFKKTEE